MNNYVSANEVLPPVCVDQAWDQHRQADSAAAPELVAACAAASLPGAAVALQSDQLVLRRSLERRRYRVHAILNPPDNATGGSDSIPQMTVLVTTISRFLCPSDSNPGSSGTFFVGGENKLVGASNYPCNIGLNRRINGWDRC